MGLFEFDVALSFAGEDRSYVGEVAETLKARGIRVFYDDFETVNLWGVDLVAHLDEVYRKKARFAVVFSSQHYSRKMWTSHERTSVQSRALQEKGEYLLPIRLDDSEVPGIQPTIGYLDGRRFTPGEIALKIEEKLGTDRAEAPPLTEAQALTGVPLTQADEQAIIATRPPGWEYLLLAGGIWQAVKSRESDALDHELGIANRNNSYVTDDNFDAYMKRALAELSSLVEKLMIFFEPKNLEWAVGAPGQPGDPTRIKHFCQKFGATYGELLDWSADLNGATASEDYRRLVRLMAQYASGPIRQIDEFAKTFVMEASRIPAHFAAEESERDQLEITVKLVLSIDEGIAETYSAEIDRLIDVRRSQA